MATLIVEFIGLAREVWRALQAGRDVETVKRDARDKADVAIDNAAAKARLAARKSR